MTPRAKPLSADERRASIVEAARTVVAREGFGFTTKQVADAAGIAEGTLFRVFSTKDALVHAVIEDVLDPSGTEQEIAQLRPTTLDEAVTDLVRVLTTSIDRTSEFFFAVRAKSMSRAAAPAPPPQGGKTFHGPHENDERHQRLEQATARVLEPFADQLGLDPLRAADYVRIVVFSTTHPFVAPTSAHFTVAEIARLILHGCTKES